MERLQEEFDSLEEEKEKLALKAQGRRESTGEGERTREELQEVRRSAIFVSCFTLLKCLILFLLVSL